MTSASGEARFAAHAAARTRDFRVAPGPGVSSRGKTSRLEPPGGPGIERPASTSRRAAPAASASNHAAAVRRFLAKFRIDVPPERAAWWGGELARRSDGWPQHLHTALQGLADELLRVDADIMRVREDAVFANGRLRRIESYGRRQSPAMKDARSLVAELMARIPAGGRDLGAVVDDIVALHAAGGGKASSSLPDGFSAAGFRDHLVYRGALQQAGDHRELLACPIPSFRDWLIERGRDEQPAPSGGKRDRSPAARPRKSVRKGPGGMG